jgi:spermidine synthase
MRDRAPTGSNGRRAALAVMAASGFAGLGYQIVWTQQCALWLGHETAAVLAVVAAFFGGLALGARALDGPIGRARRPARWYAACEFAIAGWSLVLAGLMTPASGALLAITGAQPAAPWQWAVAFSGTFILLLPATVAMGATLPAMERLSAQLRQEGRTIAALYASNTLGAVLGVLAAAFWLVPELGLTRTAFACAALNIACGLAVLSLWGGVEAVAPAPGLPAAGGRRARFRLAACGFLGIGYEVLVVRVLSQVAEDTVYTFALLLAVYLVGSALGAAAYQRWAARWEAAGQDALGERLLTGLAAACLLGSGSLWGAESIKALALELLGPGMEAALGAEAVLAMAAFGPATVLMGALFSHLAICAGLAGVTWGRALAANTAGAAAAPLCIGVGLLPLVGSKTALLAVVAGYLALVLPRGWARPSLWLAVAATAAVAVLAPRLAFIDVPEGGRVVSYLEGATASVSVVEDGAGVLRLRIDNRQQEGSSGTRLTDARQALLPLHLHTAPRRALFLGLGTGITASAAAEDPTLQVDAVELLPEVIASSTLFRQPDGDAQAAARLNLVAADARRFVRATSGRYDVIVADNFHPARSGSGSLYTVEHFQAIRDRLAPGGLFCQWLPLHQLDLDTLRSIVRSFLAVHPQGRAMLATNSLETPVLGLVGEADPARFGLSRSQHRLETASLAPSLPAYGMGDAVALLGSFVAGPRALADFAGDAPLNTDDRPIVAYRAPRITYAPDTSPRERLASLLTVFRVAPDELIDGLADPTGAARLAAYGHARERFIQAGMRVRPVADPRRMLDQVREPLLDVLRISADFRPAYDPLLQMARALGPADPAAARALLTELIRLQPAWPQAAQALGQLPPIGP